MKRPARLLLGATLAALVLAAGGSFWAGWHGSASLVSPPRRPLADFHRMVLDHPEHYGIRIQSFTGPQDTPCLFVTAAPQPGEDGRGLRFRAELDKRRAPLGSSHEAVATLVLLHGFSARKEDFLPLCELLCAAGFRCVIPDLPAQGDNPAPFATFGKTEAPTINLLAADVAQRFGTPPSPALLFGVSQGGAIALQAAGLEPSRWKGVASVATFASMDVPARHAIQNGLPAPLRFLSPLVYAGLAQGTRYHAGYDPAEIRPVDATAKLHMPVFIGHGLLDQRIPADEARRLFAALPDAGNTFKLIPDADHDSVMDDRPDGLTADLCEFFLKAAAGQHAAAERGE